MQTGSVQAPGGYGKLFQSKWYAAGKRAADLLLSSLGLVFFSPLFFFIALAVKLDSPGPVFFVQKRIGQHGKPFLLYKFRSMQEGAPEMLDCLTEEARSEYAMHYKLRDDPRVTRFGRFLRRSGLDELPQLYNILRGEMSLIGPRPVLEEELSYYGQDAACLLSVLPGITGYWQIQSPKCKSYPDRVAIELTYIRHFSFLFDVWILCSTLPAVYGKLADG